MMAAALVMASAGDDMDFYRRQPSDPPWLVKAGEFHGHLGPWLVVGSMVGDDALRRLNTRGHWLIDVTCSMPTDKHRPPFTCVLDGLQASSGATMGKCNLRLAWEPARFGDAWPAIAVVRPARDGQAAAGMLYKPLPALKAFLDRMSPARLEEMSRELAGRRVEELFEVQPLCDPQPATSRSQ
ncbi:MAG TPA: formylmethanofuran dehydrogenase subunit E family protein [Phycisphaerae bacterium]|nr:formylmethanofuran dehydrogenase subunit E family protein [Phycisphaerae bacterium]